MSEKIVHYVPSGARGFECFVREMRKHLDSVREVASRSSMPPLFYVSRVYDLPAPRSHTDIRRVTCLECWKEIERLATEATRGRLPKRVR